MLLPPSLQRDLDALGVPWEADAPLARRTWWRVGGPADALVTVHTPEQLGQLLCLAHAADTPVFPLGAGSNLLVSDAGVRGIVLQLAGGLADTATDPGADPEDPVILAGAGLKLTVLLARAARQGWAGLEALAGIPGTVGGAVRMNAGTSLGELSDRLRQVEVALPDGTFGVLPASALALRYRHSTLPPGAIVTRAWLSVAGDAAASHTAMADFLARRKATQPLDLPSCGSTFRNPPGDHAGRLIEAAGLKGLQRGGAQVSEKHANFIVNTGGATASDIHALIQHIQRTVHDRFGVALDPEVQLAGVW